MKVKFKAFMTTWVFAAQVVFLGGVMVDGSAVWARGGNGAAGASVRSTNQDSSGSTLSGGASSIGAGDSLLPASSLGYGGPAPGAATGGTVPGANGTSGAGSQSGCPPGTLICTINNGSSSDKSDTPDSTDPCKKAANTAQTWCSASGASQGLGGAMNQATSMMGQIQSAGANNQAQACKSAGDLAALMGTINAAAGGACYYQINNCDDACTDAQANSLGGTDSQKTQRKKQYANIKAQCDILMGNVFSSLKQMMQYGASYMADNACADASSATPIPLPTPGDCTDPIIASSDINCICLATPTDAMCPNASTQASALTNGTAAVTGPGSAPRPYTANGAITAGTPPDTSQATPGTQSGTNAVQAPLAAGGGFPAGPAAPAATAAEDQGGGAGSGINKDVITGAGSGGGGGLSGPPASVSGSDKEGGMRGLLDRFNLKKFLPNKNDYKNRGLAGMSVPSKDGVTGPNGPSIWEKVSSQYQQQKPKLIQDK